MTPPMLNQTMKQTCNTLRKGAIKQVTDYEERFSSLKNVYDDFLSNLVQTGFDKRLACQTANDFFGQAKVPFAGIDGTMYSKPLFDMVIFFGGAYAATGTIEFSEIDFPHVEYDKKSFQQSVGISS